jgi:hypothetical protein
LKLRPDNQNVVAKIAFYYTNSYRKYSRSFMKISELFGQYGGVFQIVLIIANFCINFYSEYYFVLCISKLISILNFSSFNNLKREHVKSNKFISTNTVMNYDCDENNDISQKDVFSSKIKINNLNDAIYNESSNVNPVSNINSSNSNSNIFKPHLSREVLLLKTKNNLADDENLDKSIKKKYSKEYCFKKRSTRIKKVSSIYNKSNISAEKVKNITGNNNNQLPENSIRLKNIINELHKGGFNLNSNENKITCSEFALLEMLFIKTIYFFSCNKFYSAKFNLFNSTKSKVKENLSVTKYFKNILWLDIIKLTFIDKVNQDMIDDYLL